MTITIQASSSYRDNCMIEFVIDSDGVSSVLTTNIYGEPNYFDGDDKGRHFRTRASRYDRLEIHHKEKGPIAYIFEDDCSLDVSKLYHIDLTRNPILFFPNLITDSPLHFQDTTIIVGDVDNTFKLTQFEI